MGLRALWCPLENLPQDIVNSESLGEEYTQIEEKHYGSQLRLVSQSVGSGASDLSLVLKHPVPIVRKNVKILNA